MLLAIFSRLSRCLSAQLIGTHWLLCVDVPLNIQSRNLAFVNIVCHYFTTFFNSPIVFDGIKSLTDVGEIIKDIPAHKQVHFGWDIHSGKDALRGVCDKITKMYLQFIVVMLTYWHRRF